MYRNQKPKLDSVEERIAADIKREGIAVTHLEELFPGENIFQELQGRTKTLLGSATLRAGKPFLKTLIDLPIVLDLDNPFVQLALRPAVLNIVNSYMDMYSRFCDFSLDVTLAVPPGTKPLRSQNWHRDPEDKKMCKMFLYVSDVDAGAGPFMYIPQSHHGGKWRNIFSQRPPRGYYPPEGAVEEVVPAEDRKVCIGRAGTVIFCDTSGLHKGGYATSRERIMFTAGYSSAASLRPVQYTYPHNFTAKLAAVRLTPQARHAVLV